MTWSVVGGLALGIRHSPGRGRNYAALVALRMCVIGSAARLNSLLCVVICLAHCGLVTLARYSKPGRLQDPSPAAMRSWRLRMKRAASRSGWLKEFGTRWLGEEPAISQAARVDERRVAYWRSVAYRAQPAVAQNAGQVCGAPTNFSSWPGLVTAIHVLRLTRGRRRTGRTAPRRGHDEARLTSLPKSSAVDIHLELEIALVFGPRSATLADSPDSRRARWFHQ